MLMSGSWSNRGSQRCKQQRRRWTWSTAKSSFRGDLGTLNQQEMIVCMQRSKDSGDLDYWCVHTDWRSMERGDDVKMPKGLLFNSISHQKNKNLQISYVLIFFAFTVILLYKRASAHSDLGDIWVIISYDATQAAVVL